KPAPCDRVAFSNEVSACEVLGGLLLGPEMELFREALSQHAQLVLTGFGTLEMREMYEAEKLAYEVWKCMATLRTLGKGAPLIVDENDPYFYDGRSDELDRLITNYDGRRRYPGSSASGTVFPQYAVEAGEESGYIFIPSYNVGAISSSVFEPWFKSLNLEIREITGGEFKPNFIWHPFNLRAYYIAHSPF